MEKEKALVRFIIVLLVFAGLSGTMYAFKMKSAKKKKASKNKLVKPDPFKKHTFKGSSQVKTMAGGLKYIDHKVGKGAPLKMGSSCRVQYTGWLLKGLRSDGTPIRGNMFDSSRKPGRGPFSFRVGGGVIKGWSLGVTGMKKGGKRTLIIPPALGYGATGAGKRIPPNSTLVFDIELLSFR